MELCHRTQRVQPAGLKQRILQLERLKQRFQRNYRDLKPSTFQRMKKKLQRCKVKLTVFVQKEPYKRFRFWTKILISLDVSLQIKGDSYALAKKNQTLHYAKTSAKTTTLTSRKHRKVLLKIKNISNLINSYTTMKNYVI